MQFQHVWLHLHMMCTYIYKHPGAECLKEKTVEPLYGGPHQDPAGCLVYRGVPNSEEICTQIYVFGTADSVLIREVSFIERFHCTNQIGRY